MAIEGCSGSLYIFAANKYSQHAKEKLGNISAFMQHYKVPLQLQKTIYSYYQNIMSRQLSDDDDKFISELPQSLQHELHVFKKVGLIRNLAAFRGATDSCLRDVARALKSRFYSPGEKVINKGDVGHEMYIVSRGAVKIICNDEVIATLKEGQFFGEIALIEHSPRTADVIAQTYSDIYILEKESFKTISDKHPQLYQTIKKTATERQKAPNKSRG